VGCRKEIENASELNLVTSYLYRRLSVLEPTVRLIVLVVRLRVEGQKILFVSEIFNTFFHA
jgi:hypothetical protein